ncbi:MAG: iron-sulfur cluster assembly protein, partial [Gammaproteobacteria bacterium]|nr:iron-sulfur cluster assembly protein [Gammaproteobacteria bacterium]
MKHVNLDPELEKKKADIMKQFREDEPAAAPESPPSAPGARVMVDFPVAGRDTARSAPPPPQTEPQPTAEPVCEETLRERVIEALKGIYDPEIPVNIYDLGLIYRVDIKDGFADIDMT